MKTLKLKKWIKNLLMIIIVVLVSIILIHFILSQIKRVDDISKECDEAYGRTCNWYEVENFKGRAS